MLSIRFVVFVFGLICFLGWPIRSGLGSSPSASIQNCLQLYKKIPLTTKHELSSQICNGADHLALCSSVKHQPICHWEKTSSNLSAKRILVFGGFHGDEPISSTLTVLWMERLQSIDPRNHWRFVPILNPDGFLLKTRTNANHVDLNRNFPTKGWEADALKWWHNSAKKHPAKFPGHSPSSEPETKCAISEIEAFKPDLVISIHAPFGVLDFDGPRLDGTRSYKRLRWKSLGHFPGSLGRFMWRDHAIPVLTVELHGNMTPKELEDYLTLQDVIGNLAIRVGDKG